MITRREALAMLSGAWAAAVVTAARTVPRAAVRSQDQTSALTALPLGELVAAIRRGQVSPVEVVEAYLARIERLNPSLNAYVTITAEAARLQARALAERLASTPRSGGAARLAGAPIAHKDLFDTAGVRTAGGSRLYADRVPARDAALVARLREAGAITLGKTNTHELGGGVTTINPFFGTTHNPRDLDRIPGGSSGGSAAAVAGGLAAAATGSDTGGSIRIPAAFCGCVGFKPTHGALETRGLLGASPTFDHTGFLARSVEDIELLFEAARPPMLARASAPETGPPAGTRDLKGLRIAVPRQYFFTNLDAEVSDAVERALVRLQHAGAELWERDLPVDDGTMARVFDPIVVSEIRATYEQAWRTRPDAFSSDFAAVFAGPVPSPRELAAAREARRTFQHDAAGVLAAVDLMVTPTVPVIAPAIDGPIDGARILRNTWPFNAAHTPALSVPCGPAGGLPVGLQLTARTGGDAALLAAGRAVAAIVSEPAPR